jgi:vacuolar-type H+-ATPase subunit E/Vma4
VIAWIKRLRKEDIVSFRGDFQVTLLEKMLEVETAAKQIVENAKREANEIRNKAREDAKQLVIDGKKSLQERLRQEITQIEAEAEVRKKALLQETEARLTELERIAKERIDSTVDRVITTLLESIEE